MMSEPCSCLDNILHLTLESFQFFLSLLQKATKVSNIGFNLIGILRRIVDAIKRVLVFTHQITVFGTLQSRKVLSYQIGTFSRSNPLFLKNYWVIVHLKRYYIFPTRFRKKSKNFLRISMFSTSLFPYIINIVLQSFFMGWEECTIPATSEPETPSDRRNRYIFS